jgi:hypothetical protein
MPIFRGVTSSQIGNGSSVLFWKDLGLKELAAERFPLAFSYALNEDISPLRNFLYTFIPRGNGRSEGIEGSNNSYSA